MERRAGPFLMRHEHLPRALVERRQVGQAPSGPAGVLPPPPEAFDGLEMVTTRGWEDVEPHLALIRVEGRGALVRPMPPAPLDTPHYLCASLAEGRHSLMTILPPLRGITVRHDFLEDLRRAILPG